MRRLPSSSKPVVTGISSLLRRSCSSQQGSLYADYVPSNTPKEKKVRKRLLPDERRVMVETYVDRYRASNSGKFPTVSATKKEIGGGYYAIMGIIQKMKYDSKILLRNTRNETPSKKELVMKTKRVTEVKEVLRKEITRDEGMVDKEAEASAVYNINSEEVWKSTGTCEDSDNLAAHPLLKDAEELLQNSPEKLEDIVKEKAPSKSVLDLDGLKSITELHQQTPKSAHSHLLKEDSEKVLQNVEKEKAPTRNVLDYASSKPVTAHPQQEPKSEKFELRDYSEKPPAEKIEKIVTGVSSLLPRSCSSQPGSSYAESVPSNTPKEKKVRKRLLPDERRVMVETFVDRYRASNSGKFPSVSATKKEIGGGYYTIRAIIKKMEYDSKNLLKNTGNETPSKKELVMKTSRVTEVKEVSRKEITRDEGMVDKEAEARAVYNINSEEVWMSTGTCEDSDNLASHPLPKDAEELLQNSPEKLEDIVKEKAPSKSVLDLEGLKSVTELHQQTPKSTHSHLLKEDSEKVLQNVEKEKAPTGNVLDYDSSKPVTAQPQQEPKSEKFESRGYSEKPPAEQIEKRSLKDSSAKLADEEVKKISSSMWGNLKSLADGIISAWRKW